jgi:hypothetical protein
MPRFPEEASLAHRSALVLLALAASATLLAFCLGGAVASWIAVLAGGAAFPVALIILGAAREGRLERLRGPLLLFGLILLAGLLAVFGLPRGGPDVFGLPAGTAIMIFILVPVPLILLGGLYAVSFERSVLRPEDLDRVRAARREER